MNFPIRKVDVVSDGILVEFDDATCCYYPASFLQSQIGVGSNQIFLNYDPSGVPPSAFPDVPNLYPEVSFGLSGEKFMN